MKQIPCPQHGDKVIFIDEENNPGTGTVHQPPDTDYGDASMYDSMEDSWDVWVLVDGETVPDVNNRVITRWNVDLVAWEMVV